MRSLEAWFILRLRLDSSSLPSFSDPKAVSDYAERTVRLVPGLRDLHRMADLLLAEQVPAEGCVLVVGAGGGMELRAFAETHPAWRFHGVDPSPEMLALAHANLGALAARVEWHQGYVETAPEGPFDGASCLLTLHFLAPEERRRTLRDIHRRLKPGAPLVVAHHSIGLEDGSRSRWLARYAAFAVSSGVDPEKARGAAATIEAQLPILTPEQDETLIREAGFSAVSLFYTALTFRGWVAYA